MTFTPNQIRVASWAAIALVSWLLLSLLAPVLMPFLLAAVLAYALHPLVERLHARRIPRWLGAGLAITMLSLVMLAVVLLIVPVITKQVPLLKDQVPALLDSVNTRLVPLLARFRAEHPGVSFELLFTQPGVASAIVGTINPLHLAHNVATAAKVIRQL